MIENFKYFGGIKRNPEEEFINTDRFDIIGLRRTLGLLIDSYIPDSAAAIKLDIEQCAQRKRENLEINRRLVMDEHFDVMLHLFHDLDIEDCHLDLTPFLVTYYKLYFVDQIDEQDHSIIRSVQDIKDRLEDQMTLQGQ